MIQSEFQCLTYRRNHLNIFIRLLFAKDKEYQCIFHYYMSNLSVINILDRMKQLPNYTYYWKCYKYIAWNHICWFVTYIFKDIEILKHIYVWNYPHILYQFFKTNNVTTLDYHNGQNSWRRNIRNIKCTKQNITER